MKKTILIFSFFILGALFLFPSFAKGGCIITFYKKINFEEGIGLVRGEYEGSVALSNDSSNFDMNDQVSAIQVPAGCRVTVYENAKFNENTPGKLKGFTEDVKDLSEIQGGCNRDGSWNDCISSAKILTGCTAKFYRDSGPQGGNITIGGDSSDFKINDAVPSIKVPSGCQTVVYENESSGGLAKTFEKDVPNLTKEPMKPGGWHWGYQISSVEIKTVAVSPPVGTPPVGTPPVGTPPVGTPPVGTPPVGGGGGRVEIPNPLTAKNLEELIDAIIKIIFYIALALAPLMIIIAAIYLLTAGGNPEQVTTAKNIILYTVIGLFIVFFARALVAIIKQAIGG